MKKLMIASIVALISISLLAQGRSNHGHGNNKNDDKKHHEIAKEWKEDEKHHDEHREHHGNGHAYGQHKDGMTGREFGQHRAEEARSKHLHPKNNREAVVRIAVLKKENVSIIDQIRNKFRLAKEKLEALLKGGKISKPDYIVKQATLASLEGRRSRLEIKITI